MSFAVVWSVVSGCTGSARHWNAVCGDVQEEILSMLMYSEAFVKHWETKMRRVLCCKNEGCGVWVVMWREGEHRALCC